MPDDIVGQARATLYRHRPVVGLPASLLSAEGRTIAVIALMQRRGGLNRDRKRFLAGLARAEPPRLPEDLKVASADLRLLSVYCSPHERFAHFWRCAWTRVSPQQAPARGMSFALCVDVPLLDAYCGEWWKIPLEEEALAAECQEWSAIRDRLRARCPRDFGHWPIGVFMIWPRVLGELRRWDELNEARRSAISGAVFSLSSIGYTDWFIRQAVTVQPALREELGGLVKDDEISGPSGACGDAAADAPADSSAPISAWPDLMERLGQLLGTLAEQPTREGVEALAALVGEMKRCADALPTARTDLRAACHEKVDEVCAAFRALAKEDGFGWLGSDLLTHVEARWSDALRSAGEVGEELTRLANEAAAAVPRGWEAAEAYRSGSCECSEWKDRLASAEHDANSAVSSLARRSLDLKRREVQLAALNAEAALQSLQDAVLSAWSPFDEPFDWAMVDAPQSGPEGENTDEQASASQPESLVGTGQAATPESTQSEAEAICPKVSTAETLGQSMSREAGSEETTDSGAEAAIAVTPESAPPIPGPPPVEEPQEEPFSPGAGEACRPIWRALAEGRLSIAYQLADAMAALPGSPVVPYPDLLAGVVLANRLLLPDGPVRQALAQKYERLDSAWFKEEGPNDWNQAVNLLLVAATLKPMLLTPDIGASTVAGYLHLDRAFVHLYQLIKGLRELSDRLQGFRIDPSTFKLVQSEAQQDSQLSALGSEAHRWLHEKAPAVTIKFQAATNVWKSWLKPDGIISRLVSPVASNRRSEVETVRELITTYSDADNLHRHVRETDRRRRSKGEDIHAGALDHLERCTDEALGIARRWVALVETQGKKGDRARSLLQEARSLVQQADGRVRDELSASPAADPFGIIAAAAKVVATQLAEVRGLLDGTVDTSATEPSVREALAEGLLVIPDVPIEDDWSVSMAPLDLVAAIGRAEVLPLSQAFEARASAGDLHAAELLMKQERDPESQQRMHASWRQLLEEFRSKYKKAIDEVRRDVEVGSAYGYLTEAGRVKAESLLVHCEAQQDSLRRFDLGLKRVRVLQEEVLTTRDEKTSAIRVELANLPDSGNFREGKEEIESVLVLGDIQTANELLQRVKQGRTVWPDGEHRQDPFQAYFPAGFTAVEAWLGAQRRGEVEVAIQQGQGIPSLDFSAVEGVQRIQASKAYVAWADMKSKQRTERPRLTEVLRGLGFVVQMLEQKDRLAGRENWELLSAPVEDRSICPVPGFGSVAKGRYRIVCLWQRPAEEDIVQAVGDTAQQRPTIVLYFGRMQERKWRETSLIAKRKRRSFLLVDEVMLVRLAAESGSRLGALFHLTLPFAYSTPYDATAGLVAPEMFFGRAAELDAVCGLNGRCFIYGGRQLGKTALLRRAEQSFHAPELHRHAGWIDLRAEGIGVSRAPSDIWITITDKLRHMGVLGDETPTPNLQKRGAIEAVTGAIADFVGSGSDRRVLILLDEADRFFEKDSHADFAETRRLKQLMETTDRRFKVVFAGLHNVLRMTEQANHPLAHLGEPIRIGPLIEEGEVKDAEQLVQGPMAAAGFEFESRSLVIRILAQTNYYPSLIQLYCSHLLKHMLEKLGGQSRPSGPRYTVTDRDIETVYSSGALRSEIRSKFRLTLQLDPRYELVAYVLAHELLRDQHQHGNGLEWQRIWQSAALRWWPEGFRGTSQLHFRNLLDEMVELGVLSRIGTSYTMRNPNVLLLLGTEDEIETVLLQDRELPVEFESATFHAPLRSDPYGRRRQPLTYQQLDQLTRRENRCMGIVGLPAAGIADVVAGLDDYLQQARSVLAVDACTDHVSFARELRTTLGSRSVEGTTLIVVPPHVPWASNWIEEADAELRRLRSDARYATVLFVADAETMWRLVEDSGPSDEPAGLAWMTLLPWRDGFVRHWLQEQHLPSEAGLRKQIREATGYWPQLLRALTDGCSEANELQRRLERQTALLASRDHAGSLLRTFALDGAETIAVLSPLAILEKPMTPDEIAAEASLSVETVEHRLRWADLLGVATRAGAEYWQVESLVGRLLLTSAT